MDRTVAVAARHLEQQTKKHVPVSRSGYRLQGISYWLLRIAFDAAGAVALYTSGQQLLGTIFALVAALNPLLGYAWRQNKADVRKST